MTASREPRSTTDSGIFSPLHPLEYEVIRKLRSHPAVKISSLVVRRLPDGVCLEGLVDASPNNVELQDFLRDVEELTPVVNRLVFCHHIPRKG